MPGQRIKGQEVEILFVKDGEVQSDFTDVQSFEFTSETEILEEMFLGEKANRYDEVYKGYAGAVSMHNSTPGLFDFMEAIKDRAQRRSPGTVINLKATLNFPSGARSRIILQDLFFDPQGIAFGSRTEYGSTTFNFKGTDWRHL